VTWIESAAPSRRNLFSRSYVANYSGVCQIVFDIVESATHGAGAGQRFRGCIYFMRGDWNGRGAEVSVECDARQQVAAMAEPLSAMAAGDLFGPAGGYGAGSRFLESLLEREETVLPISSMDA